LAVSALSDRILLQDPFLRRLGSVHDAPPTRLRMTVARAAFLFLVAALAEIGGCWLIWQAVRESKPWWLAIGGGLSLVAYGFIAAAQSDSHFGRVLAAYGGVFVAGSLLWGVLFDGFRPTRYDLIGAAVCIAGVAIIVAAPRQ
jgi:small multidrug resistance family-3 protein